MEISDPGYGRWIDRSRLDNGRVAQFSCATQVAVVMTCSGFHTLQGHYRIAPSRRKPGRPITLSVSIIRYGNASLVWCVRPSRSPKHSRITSGLSSISFVTTILREEEHYLCSPTSG